MGPTIQNILRDSCPDPILPCGGSVKEHSSSKIGQPVLTNVSAACCVSLFFSSPQQHDTCAALSVCLCAGGCCLSLQYNELAPEVQFLVTTIFGIYTARGHEELSKVSVCAVGRTFAWRCKACVVDSLTDASCCC